VLRALGKAKDFDAGRLYSVIGFIVTYGP